MQLLVVLDVEHCLSLLTEKILATADGVTKSSCNSTLSCPGLLRTTVCVGRSDMPYPKPAGEKVKGIS